MQKLRLGPRGPFAAARDGLHPGHQLPRVEGFGQIIVGAQLQAHDFVHILVAGREHDNGQVGFGANAPADLVTVQLGQHQIEHQQRRRLPAHRLQRGLPVAGRRHAEAIALQIHPRQFNNVGFVVDKEN